MNVFVISSCERGIDEGYSVVAVRSSMALAEQYIREQGKLRDWRTCDDDNSAFATVWVGSRRRGSEYAYSVRAHKMI
jgi:hypothetical protein